jgi:protein-S-isoprenylcysteine O-methyltransferase Ste14
MGFLTGTAFLASNWLFFGIVLVSVIDLVLRIPREEKMMIETFGHQYKEYARKTGALLPR